jgi:arylsulfatase A-like enzyme
VVDWIPPESSYGLDINDTTMAEVLLAAGYETHAVGKVWAALPARDTARVWSYSAFSLIPIH